MAFLTTMAASAQQPFITTWQTNNPGTSNSTSITIPTTGGGYNYEVDWNNDGIYDQTGITGLVTHDFGVAGTYTIRIRGAFPRIYFNFSGDRQKLLHIGQWGDTPWTNMLGAFYGCSNLNISATDLPNLSGVTDMTGMFRDCSTLNGPANIGNWNTTTITNMLTVFLGASAFNQPLSNWNTINVTTMGGMFEDASAFNQPIGNWNTANVTNMNYMFGGASAFNQSIGTWNTANVHNMSNMFNGASAFNQPIGNWNTASVTNMGSMFRSASAFNQPVGTWNTANVTDMNNMFRLASTFNQPIGNWNTTNVTTMGSMFFGATAFNQTIGTWTLNAAVNLSLMLNNSGMDCDHYSATLIGWNSNPATPNGRSLGADGRQYGINAVAARTNLDVAKTWSFSGDVASGVDCSLALPVTLISFSGKQEENGILLEWQTASEQNNAGFHIERSYDGLRWTDIGFLAGQGTTSEAQHYSFLDEKPLAERNYYRLRQTDFDGREEVSQVVSIHQPNAGTVRIFPNPVSTGELHLLLPEHTEAEIMVQLFSPWGQLVRSMIIGSGPNMVDVKALPTGTYTLQIVRGKESSFEKIIVQH